MTDDMWWLDGPVVEPTTAKVQEVLQRAARVVIAERSPDGPDSAARARTVVRGDDIAELARLLAIVDGGTGDTCRCSGWPTIVVHDVRGDRIATWTVHHRDGLRGVGSCDAELRDGPALAAWLAGRGLTGLQELRAEQAVRQAQAEQRRERWIQAAPPGLSGAAEAVAQRPATGDWSEGLQAAEDHLAALLHSHYSDGVERVGALLAWAGVTARRTGAEGSLWYDTTVREMLLAEPDDLVFAALAVQTVTPAQLDGATDLFGCAEWRATHAEHLPEPLSASLIAHIRATGTDVMRRRLEWGYYGDRDPA
ncbi:hypothetical protein AB0L06_18550 [Spirillospora sp. NPDC052269]